MNRPRRQAASLFLAVALAASAAPAKAMPERLSGAEICAWIEGNTVVGVWSGTPYRQHFRPDGTTAYKAEGTGVDEGRWWVTEDSYCSWWRGSGEACYQVLRDGETLTWRTTGLLGRSFDARVVPGDQLRSR
jgi:hypothetical protein